jgi:hypothetical protein
MNSPKQKRSNHGQALIVTALIIALLFVSTFYYVLEAEKDTISLQSTSDTDLSAVKASSKNTLISALANISNGGGTEVLAEDLKMLSSTLHTHSYDAECDLSFTLLNSPLYQGGTRISWGDLGFGVSSAYASFVINDSGLSGNYFTTYGVNITTALQIEGICNGEGAEKTVNISCTVYDENGPCLANKIDIFYQNQTDSSWLKVGQQNNQTIIDYHNGTYDISFVAFSPAPINVSAQVNDARNIFVIANTTCIQTLATTSD